MLGLWIRALVDIPYRNDGYNDCPLLLYDEKISLGVK
jgi:hypothetical protein